MRFLFSACLLLVLLAAGFVLAIGRMLAAVFVPLPESGKPLRA